MNTPKFPASSICQRIGIKLRLLRKPGFAVESGGTHYVITYTDAGHTPTQPFPELEPPHRHQVIACPAGRLGDRYPVITLSQEWLTEKEMNDALQDGWYVIGKSYPVDEIRQGIVDAMLRTKSAEIVSEGANYPP
jgi:hypothetical protein